MPRDEIREANADAGEEMFRFADDLGPAKIVHITEPSIGLRAIVVIDNVACGPAIGGLRMAPDVSVEECFRLARAMTLKNASAGLSHGGGKSVIFGDPRVPLEEKECLIRAFACAIADLKDYIPGPDMGTDERCMAWIQDEIGRSVGLPPEIGGIPLDEIGATGYGVAVACEVAQDFCDVAIKGARVAIQGFGSVGRHAARFLAEKGAVLVGVSDSKGALHDPDGIDVAELIALKERGGGVLDYPGGEKGDRDAVLDMPCEILVPAARPDVIRADNVARLRTKLVVQGANIPVTEAAEAALHARGILSIPDFIANAGGVICAAVEYHGGNEAQAFQSIADKIGPNTERVLEAAKAGNLLPRAAAVAQAERRLRKAMALRRWS
jgi:glutamate dehydrogenase (NAD(P)+)